jgi:hypothetical protein
MAFGGLAEARQEVAPPVGVTRDLGLREIGVHNLDPSSGVDRGQLERHGRSADGQGVMTDVTPRHCHSAGWIDLEERTSNGMAGDVDLKSTTWHGIQRCPLAHPSRQALLRHQKLIHGLRSGVDVD